jgi:hypothetical protein
MIVTLHGSSSWAFDEFFLWQSYAAERGYGILALQWWLGSGEQTSGYYTPDRMYTIIENALRGMGVQPGKSLVHGFSRGSSNIYAVTALDRHAQNDFFALTVANAGGASVDYPPNVAISSGAYGATPFAGTHWALFCGGSDPNPDQSGCPAMSRTRDWIIQYGGTVDLFIQDASAGHGGFHTTPAHVNAALDAFERLIH